MKRSYISFFFCHPLFFFSNSNSTIIIQVTVLCPSASPCVAVSEETIYERCVFVGFFRAFDENCDQAIDFKEFVCGLSASSRGPAIERFKCAFYDSYLFAT